MSINSKIESLQIVGKFLTDFLAASPETYNTSQTEFHQLLQKAEQQNAWFTQENIMYILQHWANNLQKEKLEQWLMLYDFSNIKPKNVGLILAGNIPMVGLHDVLCVLLCSHKALIKLSSKDSILIPFLLNLWKEIDESIDFEFVEKLENYESIIATGSNNSALYFESYFKNVPHIIRKNRTSVAVVSGNETNAQLQGLAEDIFTYFGLGCRNVTQLFLPENYEIDILFNAFFPYKEVINHHKYANNYDYHKAIFLLNKDMFWDNNFAMLKESDALFSPISVINYQFYQSIEQVKEYLTKQKDTIQCIVSEMDFDEVVPLGNAQKPLLHTYADGIDTMEFLLKI